MATIDSVTACYQRYRIFHVHIVLTVTHSLTVHVLDTLALYKCFTDLLIYLHLAFHMWNTSTKFGDHINICSIVLTHSVPEMWPRLWSFVIEITCRRNFLWLSIFQLREGMGQIDMQTDRWRGTINADQSQHTAAPSYNNLRTAHTPALCDVQ